MSDMRTNLIFCGIVCEDTESFYEVYSCVRQSYMCAEFDVDFCCAAGEHALR